MAPALADTTPCLAPMVQGASCPSNCTSTTNINVAKYLLSTGAAGNYVAGDIVWVVVFD